MAEFVAAQLPRLHAAQNAAAARVAVRALRGWGSPGARLLAALPLLRQLAPSDASNAELFFDVLAVGSKVSTASAGATP